MRDLNEEWLRRLANERKTLSAGLGDIDRSVFALALGQVEQAVFIVDCTTDDFIINWANTAAFESRDDPEAPMIGLPWHVCFPESPEGCAFHIFKQVVETGRPFESDDFPLLGPTDHFESAATQRSAYWKWRYIPVVGADGIPHILVIGFNITQAVYEAKREEEEKIVNHLLAKGLGNTSVSVIYFSPDLRLKWLNFGALTFLNQPMEELAGRRLSEVLPDLGKQIEEHVRHVLVSGRSLSVNEFPCSFPGGRKAFWSLTYAPIKGSEGKVRAVLATGMEVTKHVVRRWEAEEAAYLARLRTSQLEAVIESIRSAVVITDAEGRRVDSNRAALDMLGLSNDIQPTGAFDESLLQLGPHCLDGSPLSPTDLPITNALAGEIFGDFEFQITAPDGSERILSLSGAPVRDEREAIVMAVFLLRDITEQKRLDHLKDEFLATAAHELKTPVTVMKGFAQILARFAQDYSPEQRKALEAIDRNANRIDGLVGELLDVSRIQADALKLRKEHIDFSSLVAEVVGRMATQATHHQIVLQQQENIAVRGDRGRLESVLFNLIDNAIRYSPEGGKISVFVLERDGEVVVSVNDPGVGIPKRHQQHIFERFYRAHGGTPYDYGGIGVGLYISKEIISRHGGQMWFESEEGKGSTFYFSLPSEEGGSGRQEKAGSGS